jgi:hypothetical protein
MRMMRGGGDKNLLIHFVNEKLVFLSQRERE